MSSIIMNNKNKGDNMVNKLGVSGTQTAVGSHVVVAKNYTSISENPQARTGSSGSIIILLHKFYF